MTKQPKLLNTKEAAELLGKAPNTLVIWRCTGAYGLPYVKVGGSVRYREEDLLTFLEANTVRAEHAAATA